MRKVLAVICLLLGAGAGVGPSCSDRRLSVSCVPGDEAACACAGNKGERTQVCLEDRTFGPCECDRGSGGQGGSGQGGSGQGGSGSHGGDVYDYPDVTPCEAGGNILFFDGDMNDPIHAGRALIVDAAFTSDPSETRDVVQVQIDPADEDQGSEWRVALSSEKLHEPLELRDYIHAEAWGTEEELAPGFEVGEGGEACGVLSAKFKITELAWTGPDLARLTVTFEQHCGYDPPALRGCLHYETSSP